MLAPWRTADTELLTHLGALAADKVRNDHLRRMRDALAVHRGREVKALGDGLMAVFDSASDALACAVTMQRAITRHPRQRHAAPPLEMRVGLSAGEATVAHGDFHGVAVVEAKRLCAAATDCGLGGHLGRRRGLRAAGGDR